MPINETALRAFRDYRPQGTDIRVLDNEAKLKPIDNGVSEISCFTQGYGRAKPFLKATPSKVEDAGRLPKLLNPDATQLATLKGSPAAFGELLSQTITDNSAYFNAKYESFPGKTRFQYNNIMGQRIMQLLSEADALSKSLYAGDTDKLTKAAYFSNTKAFDLLAREILFDNFEINGYGSFGHDATFVHVYERRLEQLQQVPAALRSEEQQNEIAQIQGELDAIFREKYVYNSGDMRESDSEKSTGLVFIDRASRQRVSEVEATQKTIVPRFEVLNVTSEGQDRAVYFDAQQKKYFFDGTGEQVPETLVGQIRRRALSENENYSITARRAKPGEPLRSNFRFDWDGDGWVSDSRISWVSWAGHCNDKANLENAGVVIPSDNPGVKDYCSATGTIVHYDRDRLNEIPMSFSELGTYMQEPRLGARPSLNLSNDEFGGARWDNWPDKLHFGSYNVPSRNRPNKFTIDRLTKDGKTYSASEAFREKLVAADEKSAEPNPLYLDTVEGDRVRLKVGGAKIEATAELQIFNTTSGYPEVQTKKVVLDFASPAAEPILVDTEMRDAANREMREILVDTKKKELIVQLVRFQEKAGGGYERVPVGAESRSPLNPETLMVSRESKLDDPKLYFDFIKEALIAAKNFTSETALDEGIWNGSTKRLKEAKVWRDDATKWAKVSLDVDARYGSGKGAFLVKLKDSGEPDYFVPLAAAFDFIWRTDVAIAPEKDGLVNSTGFERGFVQVRNGRVDTSAAANAMELLHLGFNKQQWSIQHEGTRYMCDTQEAFDRERAKLEQLRQAAINGEPGPGPGPGPGGVGTLLKDAASIAKGVEKPYTLTAEGDGKMIVKLLSKTGDADLFVKVGGPASKASYDKKSDLGAGKADEVTVDVKKGQTVGIGVLGYSAATYELEVTGPKAGGTPPAEEPVNFSLAGAVTKGQKTPFTIDVKKTGKLALAMTGDGDADVYLKIGAEPTTEAGGFDTRLYDSGSTESGSIDVKAGDKLYGFVHGYADGTSNYSLTIKHV